MRHLARRALVVFWRREERCGVPNPRRFFAALAIDIYFLPADIGNLPVVRVTIVRDTVDTSDRRPLAAGMRHIRELARRHMGTQARMRLIRRNLLVLHLRRS